MDFKISGHHGTLPSQRLAYSLLQSLARSSGRTAAAAVAHAGRGSSLCPFTCIRIYSVRANGAMAVLDCSEHDRQHAGAALSPRFS